MENDPTFLKINTEFRLNEVHTYAPSAIFVFHRPKDLPDTIPTVVIKDIEGDVDVVGELRELGLRCDSLSWIATVNAVLSFGLVILIVWKVFGVF